MFDMRKDAFKSDQACKVNQNGWLTSELYIVFNFKKVNLISPSTFIINVTFIAKKMSVEGTFCLRLTLKKKTSWNEKNNKMQSTVKGINWVTAYQ